MQILKFTTSCLYLHLLIIMCSFALKFELNYLQWEEENENFFSPWKLKDNNCACASVCVCVCVKPTNIISLLKLLLF